MNLSEETIQASFMYVVSFHPCAEMPLRSKEIALHLGIAKRTVKAHLDSVYNKLGVDSRAAAVTTAIERGLLSKKS